uniref:p53 DNA-binding domain-containing protein n=1 Tax=Homalodisca liturata TaxID=320908 RepID=A0A1B6JTJ9_9HEMI
MDATQENLLTSSDYEHIIDDLRCDSQFQQYHLPLQGVQNHISVKENPVTIDSPLAVPNPPTLKDYGTIQEPLQNCTTLEVSPPLFSPTSTIPCRDDYPGPLEFEIFLDSATAHRRSWVFSHKLNKVFIDMEKSLLVKFRIKNYMSGLLVRALPVYSMADYVSVPVQRCTLHELNFDTQRLAHTDKPPYCFCVNFDWVRHVVQSSHSQAIYHYDSESDRHSVLVPLEQPPVGADFSTVEYHFTCKTSCPLGMNRKPIDVIFTLETEQCEVIGRQIMAVKICSCPKRDKEKEEADVKNNGPRAISSEKRKMSSQEKQEATKKIKSENGLPQGVGPEQAMNNAEDGNINQNANLKTKELSGDSALSTKLLELISAQNSQLAELRQEIYQQRAERHEQQAEIQQQRVEMQQLRLEIHQQRAEIQQQRFEMQQHRSEVSEKLDVIYNVLRQGCK